MMFPRRLPRLASRILEALGALPWAELAVGAALIGGWALITWAIASVARLWQLWPLSAGLFLLSVVGWRMLATIARDGLYALTRETPRGKR